MFTNHSKDSRRDYPKSTLQKSQLQKQKKKTKTIKILDVFFKQTRENSTYTQILFQMRVASHFTYIF